MILCIHKTVKESESMSEERKQNLRTENFNNCKINASSYLNGIIFMPIIYGCRIGVSVVKKEDGSLSVKSHLDKSFWEIIQEDEEVEVTEISVPGLRDVLIACILTIVVAVILKMNINYTIAICSLILAVPKIVLIAKLVYKVKISGELAQMGRYHAAEHMAVNAFRELKRAPIGIYEIEKFSKYSKTCGVKEEIKPIIPKLLFCISLLVTQDLLKSIIITIPISIIIIHMISAGVFRFFQILVVEKPTCDELYLALVGIKVVDEYVSSVRFKNVEGENFLDIEKPIE